jgi:hypothetical protein
MRVRDFISRPGAGMCESERSRQYIVVIVVVVVFG